MEYEQLDKDFRAGETAMAIRYAMGRDADPEDREHIEQLYKFHAEYLRVTSHADPSRPSQMADGTVVYWSWQAEGHAQWFALCYSMAIACNDPDDFERSSARQQWRETNWNDLHAQTLAECRRDAHA